MKKWRAMARYSKDSESHDWGRKDWAGYVVMPYEGICMCWVNLLGSMALVDVDKTWMWYHGLKDHEAALLRMS